MLGASPTSNEESPDFNIGYSASGRDVRFVLDEHSP